MQFGGFGVPGLCSRSGRLQRYTSASPSLVNPTSLNPTPATCHKRKKKLRCNFWKVALQKLHCQHSDFCSATVVFFIKSCAATSEELHGNIEKAALQECGVFLLLPCGFQAPTYRPPRLGPAEHCHATLCRIAFSRIWRP